VTFTKDWQRVGDMAARTIVIRSAFGDFYELECSSHALSLAPSERFCFPLEIHHYSGDRGRLLRAANRLLGRKVDWGRI